MYLNNQVNVAHEWPLFLTIFPSVRWHRREVVGSTPETSQCVIGNLLLFTFLLSGVTNTTQTLKDWYWYILIWRCQLYNKTPGPCYWYNRFGTDPKVANQHLYYRFFRNHRHRCLVLLTESSNNKQSNLKRIEEGMRHTQEEITRGKKQQRI